MGSSSLAGHTLDQPAQPTPSVQNLRPPNEVRFELENVSPHNYIYITQSDLLTILTATATAGINFVVIYKILRPDGTITIGQDAALTLALPAATVLQLGLTEGFLMSVTVQTSSATVARGDLFVNGVLTRGKAPVSYVTQNLFQGYLTLQNRVNWPPINSDAGTTGPGRLIARSLANPAVGTDWQFAPPVFTRTRLVGVVATFTTSAVVNNRAPALVIDDGVRILYAAPSPSVQAAATAVRYSWGAGVSSTIAAGGSVTVALPAPMLIPVNGRFRTLTPFMDVGDQWSAISFSTEEWLDI